MGTNDLGGSLDTLLTLSHEMLFTADRETTILGLSEPLSRMLGADVGKGTKLSARVHPADRRALRRHWSTARKASRPVEFNCRLLGADGAYRPWSWRARAADRADVIHGSLQNDLGAPIGPSIDPEVAARILRLVQDNIPLCVWAIDERGDFTYHAGKGLAAAGVTEGQWIGRNIFDLYPEGETVAIRAAMAGVLQHNTTAAHGLHWENWEIPVRGEDGRVTSVVGISLDVSDAKRAEAALRDKIDLIERQARVIQELSTPIIEVWERVVMLPLFGVLDSGRAAEVMQSLLTHVGRKGAKFAILDVTGVDAVDTATAGHLLRLIHALKLLGATGIISGIQPAVAQTMVAIGVDLKDVTTHATLRDALRCCMTKLRDLPAAPAA